MDELEEILAEENRVFEELRRSDREREQGEEIEVREWAGPCVGNDWKAA